MRYPILCLLLLIAQVALCHDPKGGHHHDGSYGSLIPTAKAVAMFAGRIQGENDYQNRSVLGRLLLRQAKETGELDNYAKAEEVLRKAHQIKPDHLSTRIALAEALSARHEFRGAADLLNVQTSRKKAQAAIDVALGDALINLGQVDEAEKLYLSIVDGTHSPPMLSRLAQVHELRGQSTEAIVKMQRAITLSERVEASRSQNAWYRWRLATLYWNQGKFNEAKDWFQRALDLVPDHTPSLIGKAKSTAALGNYRDAIAELKSLLDDSSEPVAMALLADFYAIVGQEDFSRNWLGKATDAMKEEAKVAAAMHHREFANFLSDHRLRNDEAVSMAEIDLKRRPDIFSYDAAAWAYHRSGQFVLADQMIDRALELGTKDARLLFHAARIKRACGDESVAEQFYAAAKKINSVQVSWLEQIGSESNSHPTRVNHPKAIR